MPATITPYHAATARAYLAAYDARYALRAMAAASPDPAAILQCEPYNDLGVAYTYLGEMLDTAPAGLLDPPPEPAYREALPAATAAARYAAAAVRAVKNMGIDPMTGGYEMSLELRDTLAATVACLARAVPRKG